MLEIKDLNVSVDGQHILKSVNLTVNLGEVHAIMGPNGSGKSTLANVIAVLQMLDDDGLTAKMYHLGLTDRNQPKHPLYLAANTRPVRFQGKLHRRVV